ncbi:MAG TPA: ABC transporter ATP-binding protein [Brumimicrobium sp.]|nr:ABC transporter ATP-binding protein [Brumimicrobium sp.]
MLKFEELHIGFGKNKRKPTRTLYKTEDLVFKPGDFIALIGPNGSGKTTLFNTILGEHQAIGGQILHNNTNWKSITREEKVKLMSFVPSKFNGVDNLNVYELIAMGRAPYTNILNQLTKEDHLVVEKVITELGLQELAQKNTVNLSDGERQIAMIGKALAQETKIMILDEPTAFLDYNNRRKVLQLLSEIAIKNKQLIFISSHDLELCFEYCNRVVAIDSKAQKLLDFNAPFEKQDIIEAVF